MNIQKHTRTLLCATGLLAAAVLAACGGSSDNGRDPILGLPAAELVSVSVTPATATVLVGASQQFMATASYADGTSRNVTALSTWASASPAIARVTPAGGLATGLTPGSAAITAAFGAKTGAATLLVNAQTPVTPPVVVSLTGLSVTPASATVRVGASQQYTAIATYSDSSTAVITNNVNWVSGSTAIATIAPSGSATGVAAGNAVITASTGDKSATASLAVTPALITDPPPPVVVVPPVVVPPVVVPPVVVPPVTTPSEPTPPVIDSPSDGSIGLGSMRDFAVLASTTITNNAGGTTLVTGNVGGPVQNVEPPQAPGYRNIKSGFDLSRPFEDLQTAVFNGNNRPCTVLSDVGIELGGLVLERGVYCYSGAVTLNGKLTLRGPGPFIIRAKSTLTTAPNSIIELTNGADHNTVFWIPFGETNLGAKSAFQGTILAGGEDIKVGDGASVLNGRLLSGKAVVLLNNKITK
ncbi:ice-binding family protein [Massilia mucilaginosa]|nr:ice-binding family protein [Massilia mucilaginosa]